MAKYAKNRNHLHSCQTPVSARGRLSQILNDKAPLKLVRSMRTADLLLTIKELGAESSLELVEMLSPSQVQGIMDLEIWQDEQLNIESLGHYLLIMFAANEDAAIAQMRGLDIELVGLMFKSVAQVYDMTLGEEPNEYPKLYSTSPDNRFIVCFLDDDDAGSENLKRCLHTFLERLYGRDLKFALRLLEGIRGELASGLEEESLKWRQNRLLDEGILPRDERLSFFAAISLNEIKKLVIGPDNKTHPLVEPSSLLPFELRLEVEGRFVYISAALDKFSNEEKDLFWQYFSHIALNMFASLSGDFGDRDAMTSIFGYIRYLLELGLMTACNGKAQDASVVLKRSGPKYLIRLGRTTLVGLRRRLNSKFGDEDYLLGAKFCHVDSPLKEVANSISLPEPRYYEGLLEPNKLTIRFFSSLVELNATIEAINELIFRASFIARMLRSLNIPFSHIPAGLSHADIMARMVANRFLKNSDPLGKIDFAMAKEIFAVSKGLRPEFVDFARSYVKEFCSALSTLRDFKQKDLLTRADKFLNSVIIQIEKNWQLLLG